jgi:hypothetical protein
MKTILGLGEQTQDNNRQKMIAKTNPKTSPMTEYYHENNVK